MGKGLSGVRLGRGSETDRVDKGVQKHRPEAGSEATRRGAAPAPVSALPAGSDPGGGPGPPPAWPAASLNCLGHSPPLGQTLYSPTSSLPKSKYLLSLEEKKESPFRTGVWELLLRLAGAQRGWRPEMTRTAPRLVRVGGGGCPAGGREERGGSAGLHFPRLPHDRSEGADTVARARGGNECVTM